VIFATQILLLVATALLGAAAVVGWVGPIVVAGRDVHHRRRLHAVPAGTTGERQRFRVA
jgi:hypothetical protein